MSKLRLKAHRRVCEARVQPPAPAMLAGDAVIAAFTIKMHRLSDLLHAYRSTRRLTTVQKVELSGVALELAFVGSAFLRPRDRG